jgi:uncharacterized membrane protein YciS (DUF1049 family)
MVHSPFTPYWKFEKFAHDVQKCWVATDCLFENAGESRKQQFAATALVMGLIPLTIKDIAWPERRLVFVTKKLDWTVEILVLALGLVPVATGDRETTKAKANEITMLAASGWELSTFKIKLRICGYSVAVMVCYGFLVVMEIFSKRSALGCVAPVFVFAWHVVALIPAAIHSLFARWRYQKKLRHHPDQSTHIYDGISLPSAAERLRLRSHSPRTNHEMIETIGQMHQENLLVSAVQGSKEHWSVQMAWGIYYVAGTLVFTSIMAVTVVELVVWVVLGLATAAFSKILAFFLCLVFEETGSRDDEGIALNWRSQPSDRDLNSDEVPVAERPSTW